MKTGSYGLKSIINIVDFQYELAQRKYTTLLNKALEQKEIKEGLIKATNIIDLIIEIIRGSQSQKQVKACLVHGKMMILSLKILSLRFLQEIFLLQSVRHRLFGT